MIPLSVGLAIGFRIPGREIGGRIDGHMTHNVRALGAVSSLSAKDPSTPVRLLLELHGILHGTIDKILYFNNQATFV